jgi:hypothetical protein
MIYTVSVWVGAAISSKIWASQARKQPSQAIDVKLLNVLSHIVSEKTQSALRREYGWAHSLNAWQNAYSSMYEAICVK